MAEKEKSFENPNGLKFTMDKDSIIMSFAYQKSEKGGKYIEEDNIKKELSISFRPETFIFTISAMLKVVEEYQKKYDVDFGITAGTTETNTEGLANAT